MKDYLIGRTYTTAEAQRKLDDVYGFFLERGGSATITEIQERFHVARSSAYLYARALLEQGRLEQLPDGRFWAPGTSPEARITRLVGLLREALVNLPLGTIDLRDRIAKALEEAR